MPPLFKGSRLTAATRQSGKAVRKPRADAVRNRERVLEAAKVVFSAGGPDASLEAVARTAGVGIGTLYRHFPTREPYSKRFIAAKCNNLPIWPNS